jgi:hypothetical protein
MSNYSKAAELLDVAEAAQAVFDIADMTWGHTAECYHAVDGGPCSCGANLKLDALRSLRVALTQLNPSANPQDHSRITHDDASGVSRPGDGT